MAKKHKLGPTKVVRKDNVVSILTPLILSGSELKKLELKDNDVLDLTIKIDLLVADLERLIVEQGPPPNGTKVREWAKKLAIKLMEEGLVELIKKGIDISLK